MKISLYLKNISNKINTDIVKKILALFLVFVISTNSLFIKEQKINNFNFIVDVVTQKVLSHTFSRCLYVLTIVSIKIADDIDGKVLQQATTNNSNSSQQQNTKDTTNTAWISVPYQKLLQENSVLSKTLIKCLNILKIDKLSIFYNNIRYYYLQNTVFVVLAFMLFIIFILRKKDTIKINNNTLQKRNLLRYSLA